MTNHPATSPQPADPLGFLASDMVLCALPLRDPGDVIEWERRSGAISWTVSPGYWRDAEGTKHYMVPHGKMARAILLALCTEAVRTGSPRVELEESLTAQLKALGLPVGGKEHRRFQQMLQAVTTCVLTVIVEQPAAAEADPTDPAPFRRASAIIAEDSYTSWRAADRPWVELSPKLWHELQAHAMPVDLTKWAAISQASKSALPLDIFTWLSYRLPHVPNHGLTLPWDSILTQFGSTETARNARATWVKALDVVKTVWPEITDRVTIDKNGVTLRRTASPVARKKARELEQDALPLDDLEVTE